MKSFNYFEAHNEGYLSCFDKQSQRISIYNFNSGKIISSILLKGLLSNRPLYKTTVFCTNFDSIFITDNDQLYLLDTAGRIKTSIQINTTPYTALSSFGNDNPAIVQNNILYSEARPRLSFLSKKDLRKWKILYKIDLKDQNIQLKFNLPKNYLTRTYSYAYFYPSYCLNDHNRLVISFPADTNIYESDLDNYNTAYFGKSQYNYDEIKGLDFNSLSNDEKTKDDLFNDSYGPIFFDRNRKLYLRVAKQKLSKEDFLNKKWKKQQSIIVFNEKFKIIGESRIDRNINLSTMFFTSDGSIYARTEGEDPKALHLVKLKYSKDQSSLSFNN